MSDEPFCGLQVLISHAETKDGSGGPLEYEDLESGDVFPRETVDLERMSTEPVEHQSAIMVRQLNHCISL